MGSRCTHDSGSRPGRWAGVVGGEERADDELAGLDVLTALPTSSTMPQYSWPIGVGWSIGSMPAVGPQVRPAHAGRRSADDGVGRLDDRRSATSGSVTLFGSSVATAPGEITVVRMLYGFTSCRSPSERARTACLVAA
jgi:hypothetical protein